MEYLARDFKKHTGSTFREYLDKVRLNHAFELLYGTDYSMLEVAMMSGFADVRSFIKSFKKEHGMTPYQFKKRNKTGTSDRNGESFADYPPHYPAGCTKKEGYIKIAGRNDEK